MKKRESVLVTGGAGYIGSHTTRHLLDAGYPVVVLDNLYSGHRWAVSTRAEFVEGSAGDQDLVSEIIDRERVMAVVHFAGHIVVPESVADPLKYYNNNCVLSQRLIETCLQCGVDKFIFSSSAAVYGMPDEIPVTEASPTLPINPYGRSKLITEWMLQDVAQADASGAAPFRYIALRYFNVAGASLDGKLGQATPEATHLIKVACEVACGKREQMSVFGIDYDTPDGTCIRDYIHVEDLAAAHVVALDKLTDGGSSEVYNCGYGEGFSVREVVDMVRQVCNPGLTAVDADRRPGDAPALVADNSRIRESLGWRPRYNDLELICRTAYDWERSLS